MPDHRSQIVPLPPLTSSGCDTWEGKFANECETGGSLIELDNDKAATGVETRLLPHGLLRRRLAQIAPLLALG